MDNKNILNLGLDIGSTTVKLVALDENKRLSTADMRDIFLI